MRGAPKPGQKGAESQFSLGVFLPLHEISCRGSIVLFSTVLEERLCAVEGEIAVRTSEGESGGQTVCLANGFLCASLLAVASPTIYLVETSLRREEDGLACPASLRPDLPGDL